MSYAIFRSEPIYTLQDLAQIGSHNKREKKAYKSNPDIKLERTKYNIDLVPCNEKYIKSFYEKTKEYKKEHDERMKTVRDDRKKSFSRALNDAKNVVADELLFTSDNEFFKNMSTMQIKKWADTCMEFVYKDLGYTKEQVLHATIHLDEKTPHIHCVVIPLVRKFDKRTNSERYTLSKKQYIKNNVHLSELQDKYYNRLVQAGFELERGLKGSTAEHIKIKEFKKITRRIDKSLENNNYLLNRDYEELKEKLEKSKPTITGKEVKIDKETYQTMNQFMNTANRVIKEVPKTQALTKSLEDYTRTFKQTERENQHLKYEVNKLENKNEELQQENNRLQNFIYELLQQLKEIFKRILHIGTEKDKDKVVNEVTNYYDDNYYNDMDVCYIAKDTTKEKELLRHIGYVRKDNYREKDRDDFEISI